MLLLLLFLLSLTLILLVLLLGAEAITNEVDDLTSTAFG